MLSLLPQLSGWFCTPYFHWRLWKGQEKWWKSFHVQLMGASPSESQPLL